MKALPDKIYIPVVEEEGKRLLCTIYWPEDNRTTNERFVVDVIPYIRKDALLEWAQKEYDLLYEIIPDASKENPTIKDLQALGMFMEVEVLIDKIKEL